MRSISPEGNVYQAGTLSGNPVAMAAGIAQLSQCLRGGFYAELEGKTGRLAEGIRSHAGNSGLQVITLGSIFWLAFSGDQKITASADIDPHSMQQFKKLYHFLLEEGIYLGPSGYEVGFISAAHTNEHVDRTIDAFARCIKKLN